jgi:hypothetical protein
MRMTLLIACVGFALGPAALARQSGKFPTAAPPLVPNVSASRTQSNRPNVGRQPGQGVAQGYVFWPTNAAQYNHAAPCQGLTVRVSTRGTGESVGTNGNLTSFGNVAGYTVCGYRVQGLPEGVDLRVYATTQPSEFTPRLIFGPVPADSQNQDWYINIPGGPCNKVAPATPTASELMAAWWACGDYVYNMNFVGSSGTGGPLRVSPVSGPVRVAPGAPVELGAAKGTLLTAGAQKTLLGDGSVRAPGGTLGPSQTMSAQGNAPGSPMGQQLGTMALAPNAALPSTARGPIGAKESPSLYVANACTKDPAFRIVAVIDNSTGAVHYEDGPDPVPPANGVGSAGNLDLRPSEFDDMVTAGRQYTLLGCSFGNVPGRGVSGPVAERGGPSMAMNNKYAPTSWRVYIYGKNAVVDVEFFVKSWSNNSISIAAPSGTNPNNVGAYAFVVQRADGTYIVYYFRVSNDR